MSQLKTAIVKEVDQKAKEMNSSLSDSSLSLVDTVQYSGLVSLRSDASHHNVGTVLPFTGV